MLFHIYKSRRFRKSNQKRSPGLGIPAEWQHSKVSRRNVTQTRKTSKAVKINQMLYSFSQLSGIIGKYFNVVSHLKVSQIPKIKSKKVTGTWNPSRMTTFQGQSAKHHSNKKNCKYGEIHRNATFIFVTFRNLRPINFMLFHICKCRRIRKSHQKRAPELGMPTGWQQSEVSLRNISQFIKIEWNRRGMEWKHSSDEFPELLVKPGRKVIRNTFSKKINSSLMSNSLALRKFDLPDQ